MLLPSFEQRTGVLLLCIIEMVYGNIRNLVCLNQKYCLILHAFTHHAQT